jgi:hypothetical protein
MLGAVFLSLGILLFALAIATRLQMEKEFKGGTSRLPNNLFLYLDPSDFSEKGNALRKKYNVIYSVLIGYSIALFMFMKASG